MRKCKIYFADLNYVRSGKEWTIIPFPLNVAYIAAFVQKMRPEAFDIKIFKSPEKLLDAISREAPISSLFPIIFGIKIFSLDLPGISRNSIRNVLR